jgi:Tfp pilus assembly protein PilF
MRILTSLSRKSRYRVGKGFLLLWIFGGLSACSHGPSKKEEANLLVGATAGAIEAGRYQEAIKSARDGLALDPKNSDLLNNYGIALLNLGQQAAALNHFRRAVEANPKNFDATLNLGLLYLSQSKFREAEHFLSRAGSDPSYKSAPTAHYHLAGLFNRLNRPAKEASHLRQTLALDPQFCDAGLRLGRILRNQGKWREAEETLTGATKGQCFRNTEAQYELAQVQLRNRNFKAAKGRLMDIIKFFPETEFAKQAEISLQQIPE